MDKWYWIIITLNLGLVSCNSSPPISANAADCAAVVQSYLGITETIAVTNYIEEPSTQQVNIEYKSQNDENIPIEGSASCVFSPSDTVTYLTEAIINDQSLSKADLSALNKQVKFSR